MLLRVTRQMPTCLTKCLQLVLGLAGAQGQRLPDGDCCLLRITGRGKRPGTNPSEGGAFPRAAAPAVGAGRARGAGGSLCSHCAPRPHPDSILRLLQAASPEPLPTKVQRQVWGGTRETGKA